MIQRIEVTQDIDACLALRRLVFINEQGVSEADEVDGLDDQAIHLIAFIDDVPAGTARILVNSDVAKIGRVCVLKPYRGTGLGQALIRACLSAVEDKAKTAKLGAQLHALGFYAALGFAAVGPVYDDAGIDHRDMIRAL